MKKGWENKKLGEVCLLSAGGDVPKDNFSYIKTDDYQIPIYANGEKNEGFYGFTNKAKVTKPSITVSARGTIGYAVKRLEPFFPIVRLIVVTPINLKELGLDYLDYVLRKIDFKHSGSSIPQLTVPMIKDYEIPIPPLSEQQRIVSILETAFEAIDKAKANAEQNLKNSKELFESYLQNIFSSTGEGWEEEIIKEVCELKSGTTISTTLERSEGNVLYVKVGDMNLLENEVEINTSSRFVNNSEIKLNQIIPNGAIIFPKRGGAIATNKKRKIVKPTIVDLNTMAIIPGSKIDSNYFFHWFQLIDLNSISNGTSIPQINNYSFDAVKIPFPKSIIHQQTIVQKIDSLLIETKRLEAIYLQKLIDLEELKKSLLEKAFKGELKTEKIVVL